MKSDPVSDNHGRLSRGLRMVFMHTNLDFWHFCTVIGKGCGIHCPNLPYPRPWIQMGLNDGHCHASSRYSTQFSEIYFTTDYWWISGLLESLYWTAMCCCGGRSKDVDVEEEDEDGKPEKTNFNKCCNWLFFYNPLLFPFTLVAW